MSLTAARLSRILTGLAEEYRVPGLQFSLYRDGEHIDIPLGRERGESGSQVSASSTFAFGSITKMFIAMVVMQLVSIGDIQIDEPLGRYVPEIGTSSNLGARVTMRQLLSHSSGLPADLDMDDISSRPLCLLAQKCCDVSLIGEPGEFFSYSNVGYSLAARSVEAVAGMSWYKAVECFVLRPLGIEAAFCTDGRFRLGPRPAIRGHVVSQSGGSLVPIDVYCPVSAAPGGGLCGSASDAVRVGSMLSGAATGSTHLLDAATRAVMYTNAHGSEPVGMADGWGLGVAIYNGGGSGRWLGHNGSICGTTCNLRFNPDERVVLALTTNSMTGLDLWRELALRLPQEGLPVSDYRPDCGPVISDSREVAAGCDGEYFNGSLRYVIKAGENGALWLGAPGDGPARITLHEDMKFTAEMSSGRLTGKLMPSTEDHKDDALAISGYRLIRVRPGVQA